MKQHGFGASMMFALTIVVTRLTTLAGTAFGSFEDIVVREIDDDRFYGRKGLLSKCVEFDAAKFQQHVNNLDRGTDVLVLHVSDKDVSVADIARELKGLISDRHQVLALEEI